MQQIGKNTQTYDYAIFNPIHTWVEYINRWGALARLPA
jgi:hypothetical protein